MNNVNFYFADTLQSSFDTSRVAIELYKPLPSAKTLSLMLVTKCYLFKLGKRISWLLGPTIRGQEGETIVVMFKNMADCPYSLHAHGIAYGKQSEGSLYFDNTSQFEKEDDVVPPGGEHTYYWEVTSDIVPRAADPSCLTYTYLSHFDIVKDYNSGLIGTLLICKAGSLDVSGEQVLFHQEYVFLMGVLDESKSWYKPKMDSATASQSHIKHTINGYTNGSVPGLTVCAHTSVSLHLVGMSSEPELFSVHINGQVLQQADHRVSSVGLIAGTATSANMTAVNTGRWLLSSHTSKHLEAGMHGFVEVRSCEGFNPPKRKLTIKQKRESQEWTYYIAAEEVVWDYPTIIYRSKLNSRIGQKYKKAVYTQYKDAKFTERAENKQRKMEVGIIGPVIRAQIHDVIKIVFKNMATRPYSIYPHGLTIDKVAEGANYPAGGNQTHGVQPGETHTYVWQVIEEDEPLAGDSQCLTRMYHSAVNTPRDIASGLVGPLLICKSQSLNKRNVQLKSDKEQHAMFTVFDENKSWYLDDNIVSYSEPAKVKKEDPEFYKSNVMHTINGYVFESGQLLGFCNGEIVTWHVSSVGEQDYIQTATFYGHTFDLNDQTEDFLSLFPMTGETITMNMDNIGVWLLASMNSHETTKGMRVRFRDVECFRDYVYEYEDETMTVKEKKNAVEIDDYTAGWADFLDLRSIKKKTNETDVEMLDLSPYDYDSVDVPDSDGDANANHTSSSYDAPTNTSLAERETIDGGNFTTKALLNKSIIENATEALNFTTDQLHSNLNSSSMAETESMNKTAHNNSLSFVDSNITSVSTNGTEVTATKDSPGPFNNSSKAESERVMQIRGDWATVNNTSKVEALVGELEGRITRGDVFSYSVPLPDPSSNTTEENKGIDANDIVLLARESTTASSNENGTASNSSPNITNQSESVVSAEFIFTLVEEHNMTNFDLETKGNITVNSSMDTNTTTEQGNGTYFSAAASTPGNVSSVVPQNGTQPSDIETFSDIVPKQNGTANTSGLNYWNSSEETSSESEKNTTVPDAVVELSSESSEFSNETTDANPAAANLSLSTNQQPDSSSEEILSQSSESSKEEVVIYLRNNRSEVIRTISVDLQGEHWGYEGTHGMVPIEMPDHMTKYIGNELPEPPNTLEPSPTPEMRKPNIKVVHRRQRPRKGYAMKTKKKKEYKPQPPRGRSFSPRGFKPPPITGQTPRGTRPISSEEDFSNKAIIYIQTVNAREEYEYVDYIDPYKEKEDMHDLTLDENAKYFLKMAGDNVRTYFITAEEVQWDYGGYGQKRMDKAQKADRSTRFTKVVFRGYLDSTFSTPDIRGEMDEHLGILGPVIKAEVGQTIMVFFRNLASRPYSLHANGVSYTKQTEGLSYEDESKYWYKYDNEVQPNTTYTYLWKVNANVGPTGDESDCRTWAYYSGVNPEKDINSGLIGPLLVCRKGTLSTKAVDMREFMLLFMTFDESKSWYYEKNHEIMERKNKRARVMDHDFTAINGIIFSLKGLRMYTNQTVRWHLFNMGSPRDLHSVYFHGQTFIHKQTRDHTQAVYPLLPGGFATLEMLPSKPGLWQLESEVGLSQQRGMQTLFLVLDNKCYHPLGLISGSVKDNQITANDKRGYWEPHLARLNNQGKYNAWSTDKTGSWIQVDFQRPVVISQVATQGAKQMFSSHYMVNYTISYSTDKRKWIYYKGDSNEFRMTFTGNEEAHQVKVNTLFPPLIGRFIRLHPLHSHNSPMVRMEYYGCELDGCSVPLGMESGRIEDHRITASSTASSWYSGSWQASLGRLNTQGTINAWQAKNNNMNQWLQVELAQVKKITGIITQGAKSLGTEMYVICYTLEYILLLLLYPIIPQNWKTSITLRIELLGCDFE
uniref:ferroxidase n=1 Tax=Oncorhynchus tshawytscha TaxID=74940 RepID=A0A8C8HDF9_ONCTS